MVINLWTPSSDHWNIDSGLILPLTVDKYKQRCEAKWVEQDPEMESMGSEGSPKEAPSSGKAPQVVVPNRNHTPRGKSLGDRARHSQMHPRPPYPDTT